MKRAPRFWWDFTLDTKGIVIESDCDKYPLLASFSLEDHDCYYNDRVQERANRIVEDLIAGRKTPKWVIDTYKDWE